MNDPSSDRCLVCGSAAVDVFHEVAEAPVHSVRLIRSRAKARSFPTRPIRLGLCGDCASVSNVAFEPDAVSYSGTDYEETQGFSATFSEFHRRLAEDLIARHDLRGKRILEIGCGKGDFLSLLCRLGDNTGVGFDPAFVPDRNPDDTGRATYVNELYEGRQGHFDADFVCCKMTLEHIADAKAFVRTIRGALQDRPKATVFFMVPNAELILGAGAFWDVYYEHCNYFTGDSIRRLFSDSGFEVTGVATLYGDQYLALEARVAGRATDSDRVTDRERDTASRLCGAFADESRDKIDAWRRLLDGGSADRILVLWGAGSKAVGFLTACGGGERVAYAIDVNPFKSGTFLPGSGLEVHPPSEAGRRSPELVVVMNPVYVPEIRADLAAMGLDPRIVALD